MEVLSSRVANFDKANFEPHSHRYYEFIYSKSELVHLTLDGKEYDLTPGYITVIPPGCVHSQYSECKFCDINLCAMNADFTTPFVLYDEDGEVLRLLELLRLVAEKRENYFQLICEYYFQTICLIIKRLLEIEHVKGFTNSLRNTLIGSFSDPAFDLEKAIKDIGYNPNYFRRAFKKDFGHTPLEYLTHLRITTAKQLLVLDSFTSVAEIARQCGFSDSLYFSTCFKKHVGRSPLQYRKYIIGHKGKPRQKS